MEPTTVDADAGRGESPAAISRRRFLAIGTVGLGATVVAACDLQAKLDEPSNAGDGRLTARPGRPAAAIAPGLYPLGIGQGRDGVFYVPAGYSPDRPASFVLMLHGAGGSAQGGIRPFLPLADDAGHILLAPDSRGGTWDVIRDGYGPDVAFIDRALGELFRKCAVDPTRLGVEGFSDGATYALALGRTNGDLFSHIIAFSPGFLAPAQPQGAPRIYVSHGTRDQVLPIEACSRRIVPQLERAGYRVLYHEFDGPHTVPAEIAREASQWLSTNGG